MKKIIKEYKVEYPFLVNAMDYHEFYHMIDEFQKITQDPDISYEELGYNSEMGRYIAMVFVESQYDENFRDFMESEKKKYV